MSAEGEKENKDMHRCSVVVEAYRGFGEGGGVDKEMHRTEGRPRGAGVGGREGGEGCTHIVRGRSLCKGVSRGRKDAQVLPRIEGCWSRGGGGRGPQRNAPKRGAMGGLSHGRRFTFLTTNVSD